jgi:hypothetical protein
MAHEATPMTDLRTPPDERKVDLIALFLRKHFSNSELIDRFDSRRRRNGSR